MAEIIDKRFPRIVTTDSQNNSDIGGGSGSIDITENGVVDVSEYAEANVQVPASAVVSGTKQITENGTDIDVTEYAKVDVDVPSSAPTFAKITVKTSTSGYYCRVYNNLQYNDGQNTISTTYQQCGSTGTEIKIPKTTAQSFYYCVIIQALNSDQITAVSGNTGGTAKAITANFLWYVPCYQNDVVTVTMSTPN